MISSVECVLYVPDRVRASPRRRITSWRAPGRVYIRAGDNSILVSLARGEARVTDKIHPSTKGVRMDQKLFTEEQVVHLMQGAIRNSQGRWENTPSEMLELIDLTEAHDDEYQTLRRVGS